jgi:hypothetical protein
MGERLADSTPRPKRRYPGRARRRVPDFEAGRCYLCGSPATGECPQCHRPVCGDHTVRLSQELVPVFGAQACQACARFSAGDLARDEGQWDKKRSRDLPYRTCAVCGSESEQVLPRCSRCGRHLCPEHALRYRKQFSFGSRHGSEQAWYWDHEVRCPQHRLLPLIARLRSWQPVP